MKKHMPDGTVIKRYDLQGNVQDCKIIKGEPATMDSDLYANKVVRGEFDQALLNHVRDHYYFSICEMLKDIVNMTTKQGTITVTTNFGEVIIKL